MSKISGALNEVAYGVCNISRHFVDSI